MDEGTAQNITAASDSLSEPRRRRSARLTSPQAALRADNKMALPSVCVKRSITVRKIAPRKTTAPSEHDKENTPRRAGSERVQEKKQKVSTPGPVPGQGGSSSAQKEKKKKAALPSPILPSSPPPPPPADPEDLAWSSKVRRSYSRLSDKSLNSPDPRESLFGFEKLNTPEVIRRVSRSRTALELSGSLSAVSSFTCLLEAEDCRSALPEPDTDIPGVAAVKEKKRRKKVRQIDATELDEMAARMNAEFEEAEGFELVVE